MSFLDGVSYGTDQISASPHLPLEYHMSEWDGHKILATRNEYPRIQATDYKMQMPKISDKPLVKKLKDPDIQEIIVAAVEGKKEYFQNLGKSLDENNMLVLMLFIVVVMLVIQIKTFTTLDILMKLQLAGPSKNIDKSDQD
jgi:hypothetical protein